MRPGCSVWILRIAHTIVIKLVLLCPRVMREKPHPERLRNPLQQSPHPQSTFYLRTPLAPSTSRSSSLPHLTHIHLHICAPRFQSHWHVHKLELHAETPT